MKSLIKARLYIEVQANIHLISMLKLISPVNLTKKTYSKINSKKSLQYAHSVLGKVNPLKGSKSSRSRLTMARGRGDLDSVRKGVSHRSRLDSHVHIGYTAKTSRRNIHTIDENIIENSHSHSKCELNQGRHEKDRSLDKEPSYFSLERRSFYKELSNTSPIHPGPRVRYLKLNGNKKDDSTLIGKRSRRRDIGDRVSTGESVTANIYRTEKRPYFSSKDSVAGKHPVSTLSTTIEKLRELADRTKDYQKAAGRQIKTTGEQITFRQLK